MQTSELEMPSKPTHNYKGKTYLKIYLVPKTHRTQMFEINSSRLICEEVQSIINISKDHNFQRLS